MNKRKNSDNKKQAAFLGTCTVVAVAGIAVGAVALNQNQVDKPTETMESLNTETSEKNETTLQTTSNENIIENVGTIEPSFENDVETEPLVESVETTEPETKNEEDDILAEHLIYFENILSSTFGPERLNIQAILDNPNINALEFMKLHNPDATDESLTKNASMEMENIFDSIESSFNNYTNMDLDMYILIGTLPQNAKDLFKEWYSTSEKYVAYESVKKTLTEAAATLQASYVPSEVEQPKDFNTTVYVTVNVKARHNADQNSEYTGVINAGNPVLVENQIEDGWNAVYWNGSTYYVLSDYLSDTAPVTETVVTTPNQPQAPSNPVTPETEAPETTDINQGWVSNTTPEGMVEYQPGMVWTGEVKVNLDNMTNDEKMAYYNPDWLPYGGREPNATREVNGVEGKYWVDPLNPQISIDSNGAIGAQHLSDEERAIYYPNGSAMFLG